MKFLRLVALVFIGFVLPIIATAQYPTYLGGEITYQNVGKDSFEVNVDVFLDCTGSNALQSLYLYARTDNCTPTGYEYVQITAGGSEVVTPVCKSSCTKCGSGSCSISFGVKRVRYSTVVKLSPNACDKWVFSVTSCCRKQATNNGGTFFNIYLEAKFDRSVAPLNKSPQFNHPPPFLYCDKQCLSVNQSAYDEDGDSLVYELTQPKLWTGSGYIYSGTFNHTRPVTFTGYPNTTLPFASSCRGFHLNPVSGEMNYRPSGAETSFMAVKVEEYRNGNKIGEITRDQYMFQQNCGNVLPAVSGIDSSSYYEIRACPGDTLNFRIYATDPDSSQKATLTVDRTYQGDSAVIASKDNYQYATFYWAIPDTFSDVAEFSFIVNATDDNCPYLGKTSKTVTVKVIQGLKANYATKVNKCGTVDFDYVASASDLIYKWTGEENLQSTSKFTNHTYSGYGTYGYSLQVRTLFGCDTTFIDSVTLGSTVSFLEADLGNDTLICVDDSFQIVPHLINGIGPYQYLWLPDSQKTPTLTLAPTQMHKVYVEVTDDNKCFDKDSLEIKVNQKPSVLAGQDFGLCVDAQEKPLNPSPGGGVWAGRGVVNNNKFNPKQAGTGAHQLYYTYTDFSGCSYRDSLRATVYGLPGVNVGNDFALCFDAAKYLLTVSPAGGSWQGTGISGNHFYPDSAGEGSHLLIYSFKDSRGCENSDTLVATVNKNNATVDAGADLNLCTDAGAVKLSGLPSGGKWKGKGVYPSSGYYFDPGVAGPGSHWLQYTYETPEKCAKTDSMKALVHKAPEADFSATPNSGKAPLSVKFADETKGTVDIWEWTFGNNVATSTFEDPTYTFINEGVYSVHLKVRNTATTCEDSVLKQTMITVISPVGIVESFFAGRQITVVPNPANRDAKIIIADAGNYELHFSLFTIHGTEVLSYAAEHTDMVYIERQSLPPGIYIYRLQTSSGETYSGKIVFE